MILITIIVGCMTSINRSHVYNDTSTTSVHMNIGMQCPLLKERVYRSNTIYTISKKWELQEME